MNNYLIKVQPDDRTMTGKADESILNTAIRSKVDIKVGCKGGGCGVCKIKVIEGEVETGVCSRSVLPLSEEQEGYTLACRAKPKSDLVIENHSSYNVKRNIQKPVNV
ncbi:2Fe-2S iron-sulfur cluster-binding protein [Bacillus tuaregi]|uniref:2Fe-2S iron-sulfur cluster-binding protein n=1 Tax=Bacillus tuaregi TaxID=1816695 RepID=UPI0008F8338F|nr:2Fe-2S iron-sulfur cluster-binding protein [Bacillus tuaregi]